jgi:hypothetical protein
MKGSLKAAMDMPMRTGQMRARGEAKRQKRIFEQQEDYEAVDIGFAEHFDELWLAVTIYDEFDCFFFGRNI